MSEFLKRKQIVCNAVSKLIHCDWENDRQSALHVREVTLFYDERYHRMAMLGYGLALRNGLAGARLDAIDGYAKQGHYEDIDTLYRALEAEPLELIRNEIRRAILHIRKRRWGSFGAIPSTELTFDQLNNWRTFAAIWRLTS